MYKPQEESHGGSQLRYLIDDAEHSTELSAQR
jgi:hypothetical protein